MQYDEMGAGASESFTNTVKPALEQLYASMEQTRVSSTQGVGLQLTGESGHGSAKSWEMPSMDACPYG